MRASMLAGIGENAGVVDIGDGWAVTFKVESHNHPSYVEPYQGAATGVGGIVRDIMAMGRGRSRSWTSCGSVPPMPPTPGASSTVWCAVWAATATPRPAQHGWRDGVRRLVCGQSAGQRAVRGRAAGGGSAPGVRLRGAGNKIILFGARTGLDGIGGCRCWRRRPSTTARRTGRTARNCRAFRWAIRSPRRCSSSAAWSSITPGSSWASRISVALDCRAPLQNSRPPVTVACTSTWKRCRCVPPG